MLHGMYLRSGAVLEEMDERVDLIGELRKKLLAHIGEHEMKGHKIVSDIFNEIDRDGSGVISPDETRDLLAALDLHYSDEKYRRLYKAIDRHLNGSVSLAVLQGVMFPDYIKSVEVRERLEKMKTNSAKRGVTRIYSDSIFKSATSISPDISVPSLMQEDATKEEEERDALPVKSESGEASKKDDPSSDDSDDEDFEDFEGGGGAGGAGGRKAVDVRQGTTTPTGTSSGGSGPSTSNKKVDDVKTVPLSVRSFESDDDSKSD